MSPARRPEGESLRPQAEGESVSAPAPVGVPPSRSAWRRRFRQSIGWRIVALFLLLALAMTATFFAGMQKALSGGWTELVRPLVADYVDRLAGEIGSPPDLNKAQALVQRLPLSVRIDGPRVQWDSDPRKLHRAARRWHDDSEHDGTWWLLTRTTADGHRIHFGLGQADWQQRPRFIGWATLAVLLLLTAGAYAYVRHLLRPLRDIRAGAVRYGAGDFSQPIAVRRQDELGELATQVNTMAASLHRMLDAKRELLLAISHELRSPLTRARLNAELVADNDENRDARDALLRDLAEMRDLIASLLESERLATGHSALQCEDTDLNELVRDVIEAHFEGMALRAGLSATLPPMSVDRMRIRLLVRNLLDNALRHGADAGEPPRIDTAFDAGEAVITVRDFGPGAPEDKLEELAQPFYRVDAARQRASGGVGLGLYLCQLVAQAHGGRLVFRNAGPGLVVELRLPARAIDAR
jgi:signal transduction histidine kinase